jgi:hypothetical protein
VCPNGLTVASKFEKHHVSRSAHPLYWPDIKPFDFWRFGIRVLKGFLKDREFNSSDEIEEVIPKVWAEPTFDEVQRVFHNWMSRLEWVIENAGEYIIKKMRHCFLACSESQNRSRAGNFLYILDAKGPALRRGELWSQINH